MLLGFYAIMPMTLQSKDSPVTSLRFLFFPFLIWKSRVDKRFWGRYDTRKCRVEGLVLDLSYKTRLIALGLTDTYFICIWEFSRAPKCFFIWSS